MQAAVQAGREAVADSQEQVVIAGERNLLAVQDSRATWPACESSSTCSNTRRS